MLDASGMSYKKGKRFYLDAEKVNMSYLIDGRNNHLKTMNVPGL